MYNLGCKIFVEFKIECRMMVFLNKKIGSFLMFSVFYDKVVVFFLKIYLLF